MKKALSGKKNTISHQNNIFQHIRKSSEDLSFSSEEEEQVAKEIISQTSTSKSAEKQELLSALAQEIETLPEYSEKFSKVVIGIKSLLNFYESIAAQIDPSAKEVKILGHKVMLLVQKHIDQGIKDLNENDIENFLLDGFFKVSIFNSG